MGICLLGFRKLGVKPLLLLAEGIQRNDRAFLLFLAGFGRLGSGSGLCLMGSRISGDLRVFDFFLFGQRHVEFELEIDGRIVETANGVIGNNQFSGVSEKDRPISKPVSVTFRSQN